MSGYASRDRPAEGKRTELWSKATVVEAADGKKGVILSLDIVGVGRDVADRICRGISTRLGIEREAVVINTSHTHTGPVVGANLQTMYFLDDEEESKVARYTDFMVGRAIETTMEAAQTLRPAEIGYAIGRATFGVNRRNNPEMMVPKMRFEGRLNGPVDYTVPVLRIADTNGRLMGVVFGYACHATTLSDYQWSGDYPGYAQAFLEARHPGMVAQFVAGCGADINPLPRRKPELAIGYGAKLANAVDLVLDGVFESVSPELRVAYSETELAFDTLPTREELAEQAKSDNRYIAARARKWLAVLDAGGNLPISYSYPVSWWRLGKTLDFIALGGEVVVDYSLKLKERYGSRLWVAGYSHDVMAYIPSRRVWTEGGYEGATSMIYYGLPNRWAASVEEDVMRAIAKLRAE